MSTDVGVWVGAILTLAIWSFLWKDNVLYKIAEAIFIGTSAGYLFAKSFYEVFVTLLWNPLVKDHRYSLLIPFIMGIMMLTRIIPNISWMSRWPMAFMVGAGAGMNIFITIQSWIFEQVRSTMLPLVVYKGGTFSFIDSFNNWVIVFGTLFALMYFFFSFEHKGVVGMGARIGIWVLMISFGASFGATVMARISLLIGRAQFIFGKWLGLI
jgi:hypothetical protein